MRRSRDTAELLLIVSALSLCSLFLTYQLVLPQSGHPQPATVLLLQDDDTVAIRTPQLVGHKRPASRDISERLHQLLRKLEGRQVQGSENLARRVAIVRGMPNFIARDMPAIFSAASAVTMDLANDSTASKDWSLLMCQSLSDSDCQLNEAYASLRNEQRVNHIPGIRLALGLRSSLCSIQTHLADLVLKQQAVPPSCFTLPRQYEELLNAVDGAAINSTWFLKPIRTGARPEVITTKEIFRRARLNQLPGTIEAVMQQAVEPQLRVLGLPLSLQMFVLITSVAPLRAYVHSQGLVHFRHDEKKSFKKKAAKHTNVEGAELTSMPLFVVACMLPPIPGKSWLLSQLWKHLIDKEGFNVVRKAREALDAAILHLLLLSESSVLTTLAELQHNAPALRYRGQASYHLLRLEIILSSALLPTILEVDTLPALLESQGGLNAAVPGVPLTVLKDTFRLVFSSDIVHNDVMEALHTVTDQDTGILGINCFISSELCLTQEDLFYLLLTRRESLSIGDYRRLYPVANIDPVVFPAYASLFDTLQRSIEASPSISTLLRATLRHTTADMAKLLASMEKFFSSQETQDDEYMYQTESKTKYSSFNLQSLTPVRSERDRSQALKTEKAMNTTRECSDDATNSAYLGTLRFEPELVLSPNFSPLWSDYRAEVAYTVTVVRILASPMGCSVTVNFDDREIGEHILSSSYNATLGLGENRVNLQLFSTKGSSRKQIPNDTSPPLNVYTITIVRREAESVGPFDTSLPHEVCSLRQECEFRFSPSESCGLHSEWSELSWSKVLEQHARLPRCESGDAFVFMTVDACKASEVRVKLLMEFILQPVPVVNEVKVSLGEYDSEHFSGLGILICNILSAQWGKQRKTTSLLISASRLIGRWILPCASCQKRATCWWRLARWQPYSCTHQTLDQNQIRLCLGGKKVLFLGDSTIRGVMHYILERLNGSLSARDKTHTLRLYSGLNSGRTSLSFAYYPQFWLRAPQRPVFAKALYRLLLKSQPLRNTSDTVVVVGGVHWLATHHLHTLLRAVRREGLQGARLVVKTLGSGFHIPADGVHLLSKRQQEKLLLHSQGLVAFARHYQMDVVDTFNMTAARYLDFLPGKCACHFHKIGDIGGARYHVEGAVNAIYSEILLSRVCTPK